MVDKMEKQIITAIGNRDKSVCYTLKKNKEYYAFLNELFKELCTEQNPDFYDENGKLPDASQKQDSHFHWEDEDLEVESIVGAEKIFLIVRTTQREKLTEFIKANTEFQK